MKTIRKDVTTISNVALYFEGKGRDAKMNEGPTLVALLGVPIGRRFRKRKFIQRFQRALFITRRQINPNFRHFWETHFIRKILPKGSLQRTKYSGSQSQPTPSRSLRLVNYNSDQTTPRGDSNREKEIFICPSHHPHSAYEYC